MTSIGTRTLIDGGRYFESPRWRDSRLWFVDVIERTVFSTDLAGNRKLVCKVEDDFPCGLGFLPGGELLIVSMRRKLLLQYVDGRLTTYSDLSDVATGTLDDMIVDGMGRAYVGDLGFGLPPPRDRGADGRLILVTPEGVVRVVADGLAFPNGIAVSEDNSRLVVSEMDGGCLAEYSIADDGSLTFRGRFGRFGMPDGICLDGDGAVWAGLYEDNAFVRVERSGRILERFDTPDWRGVACVLGGEGRRTLFCLGVQRSPDDFKGERARARLQFVEVEVPGAGFP
jgi:sugar lactone lactonase YvrE